MIRLAAIAAACLVALGSNAHAETVKLATGDFITGEPVAEDESSVTLEHPILGRVVIPRDQIEAILEDQPEIANTSMKKSDLKYLAGLQYSF